MPPSSYPYPEEDLSHGRMARSAGHAETPWHATARHQSEHDAHMRAITAEREHAQNMASQSWRAASHAASSHTLPSLAHGAMAPSAGTPQRAWHSNSRHLAEHEAYRRAVVEDRNRAQNIPSRAGISPASLQSPLSANLQHGAMAPSAGAMQRSAGATQPTMHTFRSRSYSPASGARSAVVSPTAGITVPGMKRFAGLASAIPSSPPIRQEPPIVSQPFGGAQAAAPIQRGSDAAVTSRPNSILSPSAPPIPSTLGSEQKVVSSPAQNLVATPSLNLHDPVFLKAADIAYNPSDTELPKQAGLQPLVGASGQQLSVNKPGLIGAAYEDGHGHIIIAFQGTNLSGPSKMLGQQVWEDGKIAVESHSDAFLEAEDFAHRVLDTAEKRHIATDNVYVTGHSLGGAYAEDVANALHLKGVSFGAPGVIPDASGPTRGNNAPPFLAEVHYGDTVGNMDSRTQEGMFFRYHHHHYGTLEMVGPRQDGDDLRAEIRAMSLVRSLLGVSDLFATEGTEAELGVFTQGFLEHHPLKNYADPQGVTLPSSRLGKQVKHD